MESDSRNPSHRPTVGPRKAEATPSLRGGRLAGPDSAKQARRARGLPRKHEGRPVAAARREPPVRRRRHPTTGESHRIFSSQMQHLTDTIQKLIMSKSSQRSIRLADYSTCPIAAEPTHTDRATTCMTLPRLSFQGLRKRAFHVRWKAQGETNGRTKTCGKVRGWASLGCNLGE